MIKNYDAIVVGGGHAGTEAAHSLATLGAKTLLISFSLDKLASMPCNPSIGGPAKGIVTREIDALGGIQGYVSDLAKLQSRMLNSGKGASVQALRFQEDNLLYPKLMKELLDNTPNLTIIADQVESLIIENNIVLGVKTPKTTYKSKVVVVSTGTYLDSEILVGDTKKSEGPMGEPTSKGISKQLKEIGFPVIRLKTGTPPRIDKNSIDYSKCSPQSSDPNPLYFSLAKPDKVILKDYDCYLTYTSLETKKIILSNLDKSSMYGGYVTGTGPRYCPSIEDKIVRFKDKDTHQVFLEPTSDQSNQIYLQGLSTSMPYNIQEQIVHSIPGLENAKFIHYAYAIEYDAVNPLALKSSLETKQVENLFLAGQINGTSGYEEAAGQGLIAGINAFRKLKKQDPIILSRSEAYIGVLIDDLVTKGTTEPYRLLTARAEYRLILRNDNSTFRLCDLGHKIGLLSEGNYNKFLSIKKESETLIELFKTTKINLNDFNSKAKEYQYDLIEFSMTIYSLLKRNFIDTKFISSIYDLSNYSQDALDYVETEIKYEGYIAKLNNSIDKVKRLENKVIPTWVDYNVVPNIANESKEKLNKVRPSTIGQASRIIGVNPVDIDLLIYYLENHGIKH